MDCRHMIPMGKVYCEKCDSLFESRGSFERHVDMVHSGSGCNACVIDIALSKIRGLFKR